MVAGKITTAQAAALKLAMGGTAGSVVSGYRKKVRANRPGMARDCSRRMDYCLVSQAAELTSSGARMLFALD